tara:strand:+ start:6129 stop:6404 length:276 start_codon:yes stop_codon:yes gene_type:complete
MNEMTTDDNIHSCTLKNGDIVYIRTFDQLHHSMDGLGEGVVVAYREHDPSRDHPWFGDTAHVLWGTGEVDEHSARTLRHAACKHPGECKRR